jgi:predicted GNAT family N-acyltransferase
MNKSLTVRQFDIAEANWRFQSELLSIPRRQVFVIEQNMTAGEEFDGQDENAWHWLATSHSNQPIGTARLLPTGQIDHLAVLAEQRNKGIGKALIEEAIAKAKRLGMQEVWVQAQTQMRTFCENAGFEVVGEEFNEVEIPHVKMILNLPAPDLQYHLDSPTTDISIKTFDTREAYWQQDSDELMRIRTEVFVRGQNVPLEIEQDGRDDTAYHWIARDLDGLPVGTGRLLPDGHIGRMAVLDAYRGNGIGFTILELAVRKARYLGFKEVCLHAQSYAQAFYEKAGFSIRGNEFMEAGIPHIEMYLELEELEDVHQPNGISFMDSLVGSKYPGDGVRPSYLLGKTDHSLLLRNESEFRNVSCDLADQARMSLKIWSPVMDHKLYHNEEFRQAVSKLARRNKRTEIQILIYDSHRMVKNGHVILELARRLSSSIHMRIVHEDYRQMNHEYLLADDLGIVYRLDYEAYEGYTNYYDKTEVNRLKREFSRAWEAGLHDPNLRQLKI